MTNQAQNPKDKKKYDLGERTAKFGENVIILAKSLPQNVINNPLINQLVRASTSIGANYMEADGANSKKDFKNKIGICKREAKETMHWLRMIAISIPDKKIECRNYWKEAHELSLIFSAIGRK